MSTPCFNLPFYWHILGHVFKAGSLESYQRSACFNQALIYSITCSILLMSLWFFEIGTPTYSVTLYPSLLVPLCSLLKGGKASWLASSLVTFCCWGFWHFGTFSAIELKLPHPSMPNQLERMCSMSAMHISNNKHGWSPKLYSRAV